MEVQKFITDEGEKVKYSYGAYNKYNDVEQWIRITEGCPHDCPYCYEPKEYKDFGIIPPVKYTEKNIDTTDIGLRGIIKNKVKIMDMNILAKPVASEIIKQLGEHRVSGKVVYYELICGIDYRFLTPIIANALKESRFKNIRIGWDWWYKDQFKIKKGLKKLLDVGYKSKDIMIFMICNWKVPYSENMKKLDLCKVWNVKVADCYYDGQVGRNIIPVHWKKEEIKDFRKKVRKHNQLVNFGIDPEI